MSKFCAAVIQLDAREDREKNLTEIKKYVEEAAQHGAKLVVLPEMADYVSDERYSQPIPGGPVFHQLSALAKQYQIWIHGGSIREEKTDGSKLPYNTTMVISPQGELAGKYRKLHPSNMKGMGTKESESFSSGNEIVTIPTKEVGNLGLTICYDIRFPELFRLLMLQGAQILIVSACFLMQTGKDHWEPLLRARAIENGCYVLASNQIGTKTMGNTWQAYGNSMIIDPWGNVIARTSDRTGVAYAEIDLDFVQEIRDRTCFLDNRRPDVYDLRIK